MILPIDSINLLLAMVRGTTPFQLVPAIQAALEIAQYLTTLFNAKTILPFAETRKFGLEEALAEVARQHTKDQAYHAKHGIVHTQSLGVSASLLYFVLKQVFAWISTKVGE